MGSYEGNSVKLIENQLIAQSKSLGMNDANTVPVNAKGFAEYIAKTPELLEAYKVTKRHRRVK